MEPHAGEVADHVTVRVLYLYQTSLGPWWNYPRLCDGYWRLYWHDREGATIVWNQRTIALPPRRVVIIPAWVVFASSASPSVSQLFASLDVFGFPPVLSTEPWLVPEDAALTLMMEELVKEVPLNEQPILSTAQITSVKAAFLRCMVLLLQKKPEGEGAASWEFGQPGIEHCLRLMSGDPGYPWTVGELASHCRLSPGRFHHIFQASVGQTPMRWLVKRRLSLASQMLAQGQSSIGDIARDLGFHDRQHLTKLFSREYGIAPAEFRRKSQLEG